MEQYLIFAVLGLGAGAVSAAMGIGLVMTYRGAGIINFAHAAIAVWGAFAFNELRTSGDLIPPVPWLDVTLPLGGPLPTWLAIVIAVALAAGIGAAAQVLVFRPLRHAPLIAGIIASLGLMLLIQNLVNMKFGQDRSAVLPIFPTTSIQMGGIALPAERLCLGGTVIGIALLVALLYRRTLFGTATRAALEDEVALTLCRWSPTWLAVTNIAMGVGITTLVMILAAPAIPLSADSIPLLVIPGLTAMLVGRLTSVTAAAAAGLALGVVQSILTYMQTQQWWPTSLSTSGLTDAIPLVIIIAVLALGGRSLPTRASVVLKPLPRVPSPMRMRTIGGTWLILAILAALSGPAIRLGLNQSIIFAILALSLVILVGLAGQISLGQLAVAGIAAFSLAHFLDGWPFPLGLLAASLAATVVAVIVGLPALRIRGAQLAVVTLAGAAAVQAVVFSDATTATISPPRFAGLNLASQQGADIARMSFTFVLLTALALVCVACSLTIGGNLGRRFLAIRNNEQAAASVGINVAKTKVVALAMAGFIAGLGGGLLAYSNQAVSGASFGVFASITLLIYAYLGGITSIGGALFAGAIVPAGMFYTVLSEQWNLANTSYETVAAIGLIATAVFNPNGIVDAARKAVDWNGRRGSKTASPAHSLTVTPVDAAPLTSAVLEADNVTVRYGGVTAVSGVSIRVSPGEIVGLIGPNGAGKTSLLDALTGFTPSTGSVAVGGRELTAMSPHARYSAGLGRTWQAGQLFEDLTVYDNIRVTVTSRGASQKSSNVRWRPKRSGATPGANWAIQLLGLKELWHRQPSELSGGQRKLVDLARALAGRPSVLLADEPAAGLDSFESQALGESLRSIAGAGIGLLLIEHDLALILNICDRIYVLDQGHLIASGTPDQIRQDPSVMRAYIGEARQPEKAL